MVLMIIQNPEIHHQDNSSIRSKAASLLDAVSTTFQRSRTNSPVKKHFVGSPSPARSPRTIWGLATQFFIDKPLPNQPDDLNLVYGTGLKTRAGFGRGFGGYGLGSDFPHPALTRTRSAGRRVGGRPMPIESSGD
jgi:hypothetical protein